MGVERVPTIERNDVRAAEIARQCADFPLRIREIFEIRSVEVDFGAVRIQRQLHLRLVDPAFVAICIANQEPVCALLDDLH